MEFGSPCYFDNTKPGFQLFLDWINQLRMEQHMKKVIVGMEPTGHYWLNLAHILKENHIKFDTVNPLHVKKSMKLDDNSLIKNVVKDAKVIAQLVTSTSWKGWTKEFESEDSVRHERVDLHEKCGHSTSAIIF